VTANDPSQPEVLSLLIHHLGLADTIIETHPLIEGGLCLTCSPNGLVKSPCALRFYALEAKSLDQ